MRLQRVVIGVDFSAGAEAAAQWVARYLAPDADVVLAHAIHIAEAPTFLRGRYPRRAALVDLVRGAAEEKLRELGSVVARLSGNTAQPAGADRVRLEIREGRAAQELAEIARESGADVIAVGTHGARGGVWKHLGSTAEALVHTSPVPVLLVGGAHDRRPRRLLVPVDDAAITPTVLGWARFLAARYGAEAMALHVVSSAALGHVLSMANVTSRGAEVDQERVIREEFRGDTDRWLSAMLDAGLERARITSEVTFGEAGQEILAAAERTQTDLIVMGSRGAGAVRRFITGSTVRVVLRGAACPVLVVTVAESGEAGP